MTENIALDGSAFLLLLKQGLFSKEAALPDSVDWNAILQEAHMQCVLGFIKFPDTAPEATLQLYRAREAQRLFTIIHYLHAQDQLHDLLTRAEIPYAILKGSAAAVYYPQPMARSMGDFDFIVPQNRFYECRQLLEAHGFVYHAGKETKRHVTYGKNSFSYELHHHFSHDMPVLDEYISDGLQHTTVAEISGHSFCMLPGMSNGLVLLDHMRSHLRYAMGLRQMIDWMMFVDHCLDDASWVGGFRDMARACGLETLAMTATKICQKYLGLNGTLEWCKAADEDLADRLMNSLISTGNFGSKKGVNATVEAVMRRISANGLFRTLQSRGETNWKALNEHPQLKPFAWLYQGFRYIGRGISSRRSVKLNDGIKNGAEREALIKDLKLF